MKTDVFFPVGRKLKAIYLVMHDGCEGPLPSIDCGNPWRTLKAARKAIRRQGSIKAPIYYIAKYQFEKKIAR